jgi:hypothetical protein
MCHDPVVMKYFNAWYRHGHSHVLALLCLDFFNFRCISCGAFLVAHDAMLPRGGGGGCTRFPRYTETVRHAIASTHPASIPCIPGTHLLPARAWHKESLILEEPLQLLCARGAHLCLIMGRWGSSQHVPARCRHPASGNFRCLLVTTARRVLHVS